MLNKKQHPLRVVCSGQPPTVHDGLQVTCYRSFEEIQSLREEWDRLVESVGGDLYSSFDWCAVWWKHFGRGRQLELYVASFCDELVAVLPLFRETIRWGPLSLRVIRIVGCDHCVTTCNVAIHPDWLEQVIGTLMVELDHNGVWDIVHLGELPGYSQNGKALAEALRCCQQVGDVIFSDNDYPHMVYNLPATYEKYVTKLSINQRNNIRKVERRLSKNHHFAVVRATSEDLDETLEAFAQQHQSQWQHYGRLGHFKEWPGTYSFHHDMAVAQSRRGRLMLLKAEVDNGVLGFLYSYRFGRRIHEIQGSRTIEAQWKSYSPGQLLHCAIVRTAIDDGVTQIDSTPGYYEYKRRLGAKVLGVKSIIVFSPRATSRLYTQLFKATTWLIALVYHRVWFWHLAPWLRAKLPNSQLPFLKASLWRRFIRTRFLVAAKHDRYSTAAKMSAMKDG